MTQTTLISRLEDGRYLVKTDATYTPFVVCSNYNESYPVGSRWDWGHYFASLDEALDYANGR